MALALHYGYCDFAQYDGVVWRDGVCGGSMTALYGVTVYAVAGDGVGIPEALPSFPKYPPNPQLRHSARSRGIHLCMPRQQPETPVALALHYGYCDFAQYDGVVWRVGVCGGG